MDKREGVKWRRDTLTKATSEFIAASEARNHLLILNSEQWSPELGNQQLALIAQMKQCRMQYWIIGAEEIYIQAGIILELHIHPIENAQLHSNSSEAHKAVLNPDILNKENTELITQTRQYINSKEIREAVSKMSKDTPKVDRSKC